MPGPLRRRSAAAAVLGAVLLGLALPAAAVPGGGGFDPPPDPPPPATDVDWQPTQPAPNAPVRRQVRSCSLYAGNGSYGLTCPGATGGATFAEILGAEPVPDCWHEPVPEDFRPPRHSEDELDREGRPKPGRWYLLTCLESGIDPATKQPDGRLRFSQTPDYVLATEPVRRLLPNQRRLIDGQYGERNIPEPFAATSPSETPRVGQDVAFYVPPSQRAGDTITVSGPGVGTVSMRARMTELVVWPMGTRPAPSVTCPGGGDRVVRGDTRETHPGACWWRWTRSSAHRADGLYPVQVEARWVVEYQAGGGWTELGTFTRQQQVDQEVTEVQTIVVP